MENDPAAPLHEKYRHINQLYNNVDTVEEKIMGARRVAFGLMGAGLLRWAYVVLMV